MTKLLIMAACLGFGMSAAGACEYLRSARADTDQTVVASVVTDEQKSMSTPVILLDETLPEDTSETAE
ncbi:MAG: hypothetical protein K0S21_1491 [Rhizobiaceae bacterium]|jgi:hypothetical protein|nr:hypothetical protein [Rhizobiaceae bacterium]